MKIDLGQSRPGVRRGRRGLLPRSALRPAMARRFMGAWSGAPPGR